jgi:hypothetical protein
MGSLTRDQIINEGQLRAGRDNLNPVLEQALNDWLDRSGRSWTWPLLQQRRSGLSIAAGSTSFTVGVGQGGVTNRVTRIITRPWLYDTSRTVRQRLSINYISDEPDDILRPPNQPGLPSSCLLEQVTVDQWRFVFDRPTDRALFMTVALQELPPRLTFGTAIPWYPEDMTMLQYIEAETLRRENGVDSPSFNAALAVLTDMMSSDKIRHGTNQSSNAIVHLDEETFR